MHVEVKTDREMVITLHVHIQQMDSRHTDR